MIMNAITATIKASVRRQNRTVGLLCAAAAIALASASCDGREVQPVAPLDKSVSIASGSPGSPSFTLGTGSVSTLVGRATIASPVDVKRITGAWKANVVSDPLDVAVQTIVFAPGGQSGWHRHPGPVFILVVEGQMTFYESSDPHCRPIVRTAGQGYLDAGDHAHIARNETHAEAKNVVTYLAPVGATLRIDAPAPGNCPF